MSDQTTAVAADPATLNQGPTGPATSAPATLAAAATSAPAFNDDYTVIDLEVAKLIAGNLRPVDEAKVQDFVRQIKAVGLQQPIVVTADNVVQDGNHRLAAYAKMGKKTIPARYAFNPKGKKDDPALSSADALSRYQGLVANVGSNPMTPLQRGQAYAQMIGTGVVATAKDLAANLGISASQISRDMKLVSDGTPSLHAAINEGRITGEAADAIISKTTDRADQQRLLELLLRATDAKITLEDVSAAAPGDATAAKPSKGGPRAKRAVLAPEALNTEESNVTGLIRRAGDGSNVLVLTMEIPCPEQRFTGFDTHAKVQACMAKIDPTALRAELGTAAKKLLGNPAPVQPVAGTAPAAPVAAPVVAHAPAAQPVAAAPAVTTAPAPVAVAPVVAPVVTAAPAAV